jgi:hypothetical protein
MAGVLLRCAGSGPTYVCIVAEFSALCGLLMALASENFALSFEPILILGTRGASSFLIQLVRAFADFRFQVSGRGIQGRALPNQRN